MASVKPTRERRDTPEYVVTVQQEVGRVKWSGDSETPMLKVAFGIACDHFAGNAGMEVQTFDYQIDTSDEKEPERIVHLRVTG